MKNLKLSIIIPAYNIENYIGRTIESIIAQTYTNLEIIIVNDGSNDNTASILEKYALCDQRIKIIHKENGGVTSARICGIENATGEWVGFVDGDDYVEPDMFERLISNAERYQADISHCGYRMVFPNGRIDYYYNTGKFEVQNREKAIRELVSGKYIEPGLCNKIYARKMINQLLKNITMDFDIKYSEDFMMNYYLFREAERIIYEDICPYHYILRKGSAATSLLNEHKLLDPYRVTKLLLDEKDWEYHGVLLARLARQLIGIAFISEMGDIRQIKKYQKDARLELKEYLSEILKNDDVRMKVKIMSVWVVLFPYSYKFVHDIYSKITGIDKKYDLN